ncbi:MAG: SH3 domain-containing protein [Pseudomonadota bacterium]
MIRLVLALGAALVVLPAPSWAKTVPPEDKCLGDAGLAAARAKLAAAVEKKDAAALLAMTAGDIEFGLDEPHGKAAFIRTWKLDHEPEKSAIWAALAKILPLGCAFDQGSAVIPYLFTALEDRDAFATAVTIRPNVNLRSAASETAPVVAVLHYEVLTVDTDDELWSKVHTDEGVAGYVRKDLTHTPVGFRAYLKKVAGVWRMTVFIEGD